MQHQRHPHRLGHLLIAPATRALLLCLGLAFAASGCSTTYTEAEVESAEWDAQEKARHEEKMDVELGAMGGRNAEALGEAGERVIIETDR